MLSSNEIIGTLIGILVGGVLTWVCGLYFYRRARAEAFSVERERFGRLETIKENAHRLSKMLNDREPTDALRNAAELLDHSLGTLVIDCLDRLKASDARFQPPKWVDDFSSAWRSGSEGKDA